MGVDGEMLNSRPTYGLDPVALGAIDGSGWFREWAGPPLRVGKAAVRGGERTVLSVVEGVACSPPGTSHQRSGRA